MASVCTPRTPNTLPDPKLSSLALSYSYLAQPTKAPPVSKVPATQNCAFIFRALPLLTTVTLDPPYTGTFHTPTRQAVAALITVHTSGLGATALILPGYNGAHILNFFLSNLPLPSFQSSLAPYHTSGKAQPER